MEKDKLTSISPEVCITSLSTLSPLETSAQDVEKKKAKPRTPHLLSLNQNIVA
jgi:hypothetical protein